MDPRSLDEIRNLKARYIRSVDVQDWESFASVFSADARFDGFAYPAATVRQFVDGVAAFFDGVRSVHQAYAPEFVSRGGNRIRGRWGLQDLLTWEPDAKAYKGLSLPGQWGLLGFGHYEEEYRRRDGRWQISFLRVTRLRIIPLVGPQPPLIAYPVTALSDAWLSPPHADMPSSA